MQNFPERLKSARLMQGFSLQALSDRMNNRVSKQALSKYEQGAMNPEGDVVHELCRVLAVRPDYFAREPMPALQEIKFRKLTRLSAREQDMAMERTRDFLQRYLELEALVGEEHHFENPLQSFSIVTEEDVEIAAAHVREVWQVGKDPIHNVVALIESKGIRVLEISAHEDFNGMSAFVDAHSPVIILNDAYNNVIDRKRFTALHELGHLLMQEQLQNLPEKEEERYCNRFAGAMLLPKDVCRKALGNKRQHISINELVLLKEQFGISPQAAIYRAIHAEVISSFYGSSFWRDLANKGMMKKQLGVFNSSEKATRFRQLLLRAVSEEIITLSKAAALNNQKLAEFRQEIAPPALLV
jgi:Zn-dependent peptidase ImmA (M78 family)/DNA-binding XRE family transcriptional regulator